MMTIATSTIVVTDSICNAINSLEFWPGKGSSFSTLAGIAARVLPMPPTSASDEQLFSVKGRVVTSVRSRLNAHDAKERCSLHQWLSTTTWYRQKLHTKRTKLLKLTDDDLHISACAWRLTQKSLRAMKIIANSYTGKYPG